MNRRLEAIRGPGPVGASGFLTICMHCKHIRDEEDRWVQVARYVDDHTDTVFSHGLCGRCAKEHYPDYEE